MNFKEKLKYVFDKNNIEIIEFTNDKEKIVYECKDCGKRYNYKSARNLFSKISLCKNCYNPYSRWNKERVQARLNKLFPESKVEIIDFFGFRAGGAVKCLKCGEVENVKNFEPLLSSRKDFYCKNCEKDLNKIYKHLEEQLTLGNLSLLKWNGVNEKSDFKCNRCGHLFSKQVSINFSGKICPNCFKVYNKFSFEEGQKALNQLGNGEYELLQFKGMSQKSLVKHKCGFIYETRLSDFQKTRGCPKCYRKISKYERQLKEWLEKNGIDYVYQKRFKDFPKYSFDFEIYWNQESFLIEVQGEQHYKPVEVFDDFEIQKQRDLNKKEYCLINNLKLIEVPYWEINNLDNFLQNKFNDYPKGVISSDMKEH